MHLGAFTGYRQDEDLEHARRAALDDHLLKPLSIDALSRVLANVALKAR